MSKNNKSKSKKNNKQKNEPNKSITEEIILFIAVGFSLLLIYTFFAENNGGFLGLFLNNLFMGLFGTGGYIAPFIITGTTVYYFLNAKNIKKVKKIILLTLCIYLVTLVLIHTTTKNLINLESFIDYYAYNISSTNNITVNVNGGLIGSLIGNTFISIVGNFGTYILILIAYAIIFVLYTNKSLAKILGTFSINTTKLGISKTKEASNKISEYTENIKIQREERSKEREIEKELERELALARKESLERIKFNKPVPQKQLNENYKKEAPESVANTFIDRSLKEKNIKVPRKPNLFIIKERQQKTNNISLPTKDVNINIDVHEIPKNNKKYKTENIKIDLTEKTSYFNNQQENINKNQNINLVPRSTEIYDIPNKNITKQQQKVNDYYEEIKSNFTTSSTTTDTTPYIDNDEDIHIESFNNSNDKHKHNHNHKHNNCYDTHSHTENISNEQQYSEQSFINNKYDEPIDLSSFNEKNENEDESFYTPVENNSYIRKNDMSNYEHNDIAEKINSAVVEDNVIHGLFDYVEDNKEDTNDLIEDFEDYSNLYDDDDFDIIDELEEEAKAFEEINQNLNEKSEPTNIQPNRFLPKEEEKQPEPVMEYDEKDKGKLTLDDYKFPPIEFLAQKEEVNNSLSDIEIQENSLKLEETLKSFGVKAKVVNVSRGPTVTRYEIEPGIGVKVSKIANLVDDLALSLASSGIRIQAPIPNKPYVGIEVPNKVTESVSLREVIDSDSFQNFKSKLAFGIGKDIGGDTVIFDIGKMPHVLVAGATGSGKSVCVNTLISSIIYKARPDEVKLLMIDPKVVELSIYNGIPHLLIPVVTDPKKANSALNWAVREMERRYGLFADNNVRNLDGYNDVAIEKNYDETLPRIVVIIDELADLMMTAAKEVEDSICRLAQKARAAGIHLIIATQRPSVDVITGLIKANIPTRMAFAVSSGIDSRTILDTVGAERLLGRGDMLFLPYGSNEPTRVQGAFISDKEVENIVNYLSQYKAPKFSDSVIEKITSTTTTDTDNDDVDELFAQIVDFIIEKQKASASMLQSKFRIGFNRASRVIDQLEDRQFIGPTEGSKARKVIITRREWEEIRENF